MVHHIIAQKHIYTYLYRVFLEKMRGFIPNRTSKFNWEWIPSTVTCFMKVTRYINNSNREKDSDVHMLCSAYNHYMRARARIQFPKYYNNDAKIDVTHHLLQHSKTKISSILLKTLRTLFAYNFFLIFFLLFAQLLSLINIRAIRRLVRIPYVISELNLMKR